MSNVDAFKKSYEAFQRGDLDAVTEDWSDDIKWENPNASQIPNSGTTEGKDDVKQLLADTPKYWEEFTVTPDEFFEEGDTVVVLAHIEAKAKESGNEVKLPVVHVGRFEDGKLARFQQLFDTALTAEALGRL